MWSTKFIAVRIIIAILLMIAFAAEAYVVPGQVIDKRIFIIGLVAVASSFLLQEIILRYEEWVYSREKLSEEARRKNTNEAIQATLRTAICFTPKPAKSRACLFIRSKEDDEAMDGEPCLRMKYSQGPFSSDEIKLGYRKREGLVGLVWHFKEAALADLDGLDAQGLHHQYSLSQNHIQYTQHIKSILGIPISVNGDCYGVLSVDSKEPLSVARFDGEELQAHILEVATIIEQIIEGNMDILEI